MSCRFSWCEWVLWRVQIPLPYLKAGWLTTPPDGNSLAPHSTWERLWFVLDHEALFEVCGLLSVPKECRAHRCNICPARWLKLVLNRCQRSSWQDFWVLCLSSRLVILFTITPDMPERLMGTGIWHIEVMSRRLRRGIIWQLCKFLDVLSVI